MMPRFVNCPNELVPAFDIAEKLIVPLFRGFKRNPDGGAIKVEEERYVISRAESLTVAMKQQLSSVLGQAQVWLFTRLERPPVKRMLNSI